MATITTQTIKVDLTPGRVYPVLHVSQGDVGLEALEFHIYQNNQPYPIPSEVTAINIDGMTPVGVFSYPCTWTGNVVTAGLTATMTAERGIDICELALYDATNNKIGTCNFVIAVEESPYTNAHVSTSDMATIMAAASSAQQYELLSKSWAVGDTGIRTGENTNNSEYWSEISESWAVGDTGKRTGEDTNNSKYWSTVAHQYANTISFKTYDTVAQMKADTGLLDGGSCRTLGYYAVNDGGGALYKIHAVDPGTYCESLSNGLFAELISPNNILQYGVHNDGSVDNTALFNAAFETEDKIYIPEGTYRIDGYVFANSEKEVVLNGNAVFSKNTPAYSKNSTITSVDRFGKIGEVNAPTAISGQYSEAFCYDTKRDKWIIGYFAASETNKTMLAVVDPATFAVQNMYTYSLTDLQALSYNPNTDAIYMCSEDYSGIYSVDAGNLNGTPAQIAALDDAKILLYDSALNALVSLKYSGNALRINVFDSDYTEIVYSKTVDVSGFDQTGINGAVVHNGVIYQSAAFCMAEIGIVSGSCHVYNLSLINEIEDFEYTAVGLMMLTHRIFSSAGDTKPSLIYKYYNEYDGEANIRNRYDQLPNEAYSNVDLNLLTRQGITSVSTPSAGSNNFPPGCTQGTLIVMLQTNASYVQQYARQLFISSLGQRRIYRRDLYVFDSATWTDWEEMPIIQTKQIVATTDATFGFVNTGISSANNYMIGAQAINMTNCTVDVTVDAANSVYRVQARRTTDGAYLKSTSVRFALFYIAI